MSGFRTAPLTYADEREHRRLIAEAANRAIGGKLNCTGTTTLTANAAATTVMDTRTSIDSVILLCPLSAHAGTEIGNGTIYVSLRANGSFVLSHANNVQTDRNFAYAIIG